jgi:P-type conjugative transfer protein TrbJ
LPVSAGEIQKAAKLWQEAFEMMENAPSDEEAEEFIADAIAEEENAADEELPWEVAEAAIKTTMVAVDGAILARKNALEDLIAEIQEDDESRLAADHAALANPEGTDLASKLETLYGLLAEADAITFAAASDLDRLFAAQNPGYRPIAPGSYIDFADEYRSQTREWLDYAYGAIEANNSEALDMKNSLQGLDRQMFDSVMSAQGYLQVFQARNQIYAFVGQEISNLRVDVARQIETQAKTAALRQQRRTDRQTAFEQAVGEWRAQSSGRGY